jgi:hypothetical protein
MTKPKAKPEKSRQTDPALILFGLEGGKPRAGTFAERDAEAATKAARSLGLAVLKVSGAQAQDLASKLSAGQVHANGRGFVPFIRETLYEQLQDLAKAQGIEATAFTPNGDEESGTPVKTADGHATTKSRLPKSWDDIDVGHLVVTQDTDPKDGWWAATVVQKNGEMFTLRLQHQNRRRVVKHKYNLALMWPGDDVEPKSSKSKGPNSLYPKSWQAIELQGLVLAMEEGPMQEWWEATPLEVDGDMFKLKWRDFPTLPTFLRPRLALALLHPNPTGVKAPSTAAA